MYSLSNVMTSDSVKHNTTQLVYVPFPCTVSLDKLQDIQKSGTKLSMYLVNIHKGEPKTNFTDGFLKIRV